MKQLNQAIAFNIILSLVFSTSLFAQPSIQSLPEQANVTALLPNTHVGEVEPSLQVAIQEEKGALGEIEYVLPTISDMLNQEAMRRSQNHFEGLRRNVVRSIDNNLVDSFFSAQAVKQSS